MQTTLLDVSPIQAARRFAAFAIVLSLAAGVEAAKTVVETNDWEDLAVSSRNRAPARTYSMPLANEAAALTDALEPETPYRLSLNGIWKISWAGNPDLRVKDFWRTDFSDADWFTIDVPSCVELRGFGSPGYVNIRYPHKFDWPRIRDRPGRRTTTPSRPTDARSPCRPPGRGARSTFASTASTPPTTYG